MTICNMSIEAGARAGMVAPDETTFAYLEGRPHAPTGSDWDDALEDWRSLPTDDGATFDREVTIDAASLRPHVSWGTNPGQTVTIDDVVPDPRRRGRRARARLHGPAARYRDPRHPTRHRLHRLVHQLEDRGSARGRADPRRPPRPPGAPRDGGPGLDAREASGGARGSGRGVRGCRVRMARRRLLDVPRHEPRPADTRRTVRVDQQSELRGSSGQGRANAPREPRGRRRDRGRRPLRDAARISSDEALHPTHGSSDPARSLGRRHRPDRARPSTSADRARRGSGRSCSPSGGRTPTSSSTAPSSPAPRSWWRDRTSAAARAESTPSGRSRTRGSTS